MFCCSNTFYATNYLSPYSKEGREPDGIRKKDSKPTPPAITHEKRIYRRIDKECRAALIKINTGYGFPVARVRIPPRPLSKVTSNDLPHEL